MIIVYYVKKSMKVEQLFQNNFTTQKVQLFSMALNLTFYEECSAFKILNCCLINGKRCTICNMYILRKYSLMLRLSQPLDTGPKDF